VSGGGIVDEDGVVFVWPLAFTSKRVFIFALFVIIIWHMHVQVTVFFHETDETPRNSSVFTSLSVTPP